MPVAMQVAEACVRGAPVRPGDAEPGAANELWRHGGASSIRHAAEHWRHKPRAEQEHEQAGAPWRVAAAYKPSLRILVGDTEALLQLQVSDILQTKLSVPSNRFYLSVRLGGWSTVLVAAAILIDLFSL